MGDQDARLKWRFAKLASLKNYGPKYSLQWLNLSSAAENSEENNKDPV